MALNCEYCRGAYAHDAVKCENCGAPLDRMAATDYRVCPHCTRRLLSLGSPTCNYCGRVLPETYVKAREATLRRIKDTGALTDVNRQTDTDEDPGLARRILGGLGFDIDDLPER